MTNNSNAVRGEKRKRTKASEACVSCRKVKTRCEPPSVQGQSRCHRCAVLFLECSFQESTANPLKQPTERPRSTALPAMSSRAEALQHSPFEGTGWTPEDLVCNPPLGLDRTHWMNTPMFLTHRIVARHPRSNHVPTLPSTGPTDMSAALVNLDALPQDRLEYLVNTFKSHYTAWLNLPDLPRTGPVSLEDPVTLAQCVVACRHLPSALFSSAQPILQHLAETRIMAHLSDVARNPSVDLVYALLILATWCPAVGHPNAPHWTAASIAKGAVEMALNLELDKIADDTFWERVESLPRNQRRSAAFKVQLWSAVAHTEFILTLATTNDPPVSRPTAKDRLINSEDLVTGGNPSLMRQIRLKVATLTHQRILTGISAQCQNLDEYGADIYNVMTSNLQLLSDVTPLQITCQHEPMHMEILDLYLRWEALILLVHGLTQVRLFLCSSTPEVSEFWLAALPEAKASFVSKMGTKLVTICQMIIVGFLNIHDRCRANMVVPQPNADPNADSTDPSTREFVPALSTAPDALYSMVLLAASSLLLTRYFVFVQFEQRHALVWISTGALLNRLAEALDAVAVTENHAPRRAAAAIREMHHAWNERVLRRMVPEEGKQQATGAPGWRLPTVGLDVLLGRMGAESDTVAAEAGLSHSQPPGLAVDVPTHEELETQEIDHTFPLMGINDDKVPTIPENPAFFQLLNGLHSADVATNPGMGFGWGWGDSAGQTELPSTGSNLEEENFWYSLMGS